MVRIVHIILFSLLFCSSIHSQDDDSLEYTGLGIAEEMPISIEELKAFIKNELKYPESALSDSIEGIVLASFWVDTTGKTTNHKIIRGINQALNAEALRIVKLIHFEKPALERGKPVKIKYVIPVEFKLSCKEVEKNKGCKD